MSKDDLPDIRMTDQRVLYLQGREMGMPPRKAAAFAGVKSITAFLEAARADEAVMEAEKRIELMHRRETTMTREKVQEIILSAIEMGQLISDPNAMIRGAAELNKMCGFYAPEVKKIELTGSAKEAQALLEAKSDQELLELIAEEDAIDVDFENLTAADQGLEEE